MMIAPVALKNACRKNDGGGRAHAQVEDLAPARHERPHHDLVHPRAREAGVAPYNHEVSMFLVPGTIGGYCPHEDLWSYPRTHNAAHPADG